jgi:hypothetical protein
VEDKKSHNVSETGSVSVLRWMGQDKPTQLGPLERASLNHWIHTGIVVSNPTRCMDICMHLFCVCVVLCIGSGLATGWSPVQGVLPTVYRIKKLKKRPRSEGLWNRREKKRENCCFYGVQPLIAFPQLIISKNPTLFGAVRSAARSKVWPYLSGIGYAWNKFSVT